MRLVRLAVVFLISASSQIDAAEVKDDFVGTWELEVIESRDDSGEWAPASGRRLGPHPIGYIIYDSAGNMAVQIMRSDRPHFASSDAAAATLDELRAAFQGYAAYFGGYDVNEEEGFVTHHRKGHLTPNQVGVDAKRFYRFHDDRLNPHAALGRPSPYVETVQMTIQERFEAWV